MSQAEENYIKEIYHIQVATGCEVNTNAIAERLATSPASVSDMLKKLSTKKLLNYTKYKGVTLTKLGSEMATNIIRKHRLWEVFLVQKLHFNWDQVHEVAEELEHIQSKLLISRLDEFLGHPKHDPHGDPIPDANGKVNHSIKLTLAEYQVGQIGEVIGVKDTNSDFLRYLDKIGISLGCSIEVVEHVIYDESIEIKINQQEQRLVTKEVSKNIYLKS